MDATNVSEKDEQWKDVPGLEGRYMVSNLGRVKSLSRLVVTPQGKSFRRKGMMLKLINHNAGYVMFGTTQGHVLVHRAVALAFVDNPENKPFVNHKDGNKVNNLPSNLEWVTNQENLKHASESGLVPRMGSKNSKAKLTESDVLKIRQLSAEGHNYRTIGDMYGMHRLSIRGIVKRWNWTHI